MYDYSFLFGTNAPDHIIHAAAYFDPFSERISIVAMPPRSGKTSLATSFVKAMALTNRTVLLVSLLPEHCFYFGNETKNITVIKPLGLVPKEGFDVIVVDDAIRTPEEVDNQKFITDLVEWWQTTVITRLIYKDQYSKGKVVIIGSRYGENDFIGHVINLHPDAATEIIPAIDRYGRSYWPEMFTIERLQEIRDSMGDKRFKWLYQQGA